MPVCQICGAENPAGAEYCQDCGASLTTQAQSEPVEPTPADVPQAPDTPAPESEPALLPQGSPEAPAPTPGAEIPAGAATQPPRLVVNRYGAPGSEEFPLLADRLVVGRFDPDSGPVDIDLSQLPEAAQISRHHAEIYREADGQWYVKDLGSTNGVFVKSAGSSSFGPRLTAPQVLASGDEVAFGNARFILRMD